MIYLNKILTLTFFLCITNFVLAQAINLKLSCQISVTRDYPTGPSEKEHLLEIFELFQNGKYLGITSTTTNFPSVNSSSANGYISTNLSDPNRWDLTMEKSSDKHQIIIDRNTGQIFISSRISARNGGWINSSGSGLCKKIDTDKKVF